MQSTSAEKESDIPAHAWCKRSQSYLRDLAASNRRRDLASVDCRRDLAPLGSGGWYCSAVSRIAAIVSIALASVAVSPAQSQPLDTQTPRLTASPAAASIQVDARLDEPAWQEAESATGFRQLEPNQGAEASRRTAVRVLYGPGSLFVGAVLYDDQPARIQQTLGRRDEYTQADWFAVSIDAHLDRRTAYIFAVNAAGVQYDALRAESVATQGGPGGGGDASWNAIWNAAVRTGAEGWVVEMEIPYSMLRFSQADEQTWGVHFSREIPRLGEKTEWPLVPRTDRANLVARFGLLDGIVGIDPRRDVQVSPYTLSRVRTGEDPARPGRLEREGSLDAGADLKLGLGSNVTLNATINPDFGQVESDPAEFNLTAFETFFPERRPFFLEGMQIYQFPIIGSGSLLYTRRIGARAPIIGAAKISGRTERGLSFGVLGAATGREFDPERHYGVARASRQIGRYSSAGGMLTAFDGPDLDGRRRVVTGGTDWDFRFRENTYSLRGFAAFVHRFGSPTGWTGQVMAARRQGSWTYEFGGDFVDDRFDPNDIGRQQRNNAAGAIIRFGHDLNGGRPFGPFQRAEIGGSTWHQWSYREGISLGGRSSIDSEWTLRSFQTVAVEASVSDGFGGYDLYETRGLWPSSKPTAFQVGAEYGTDERRPWQLEPEAGITLEENGGRMYSAGLEANWNVRSRLSLAAGLDTRWEDGLMEWSSNETFRRSPDGWWIGAHALPPGQLGSDEFVRIEDDVQLDAVFAGLEPYDPSGRFYVPVFGERDTRAIDLTLRTSYTFTPDLALQLYSQFFVARARYENFRILRDPDSRVPFSVYPKRNEFTRSSFQLNAVLRWEYRPGSVFYVVWTQDRRDDDALNPLAPWDASPYDVPISNQIADTFGIFPGNVFLIKLNYTFLY